MNEIRNEQMNLTLSAVMGHLSSVAESSRLCPSLAVRSWVGLSLHSSSENRLRAGLMDKKCRGRWRWGERDRWNQQTAAENHGWHLPLSHILHLSSIYAVAQAKFLGVFHEPSLSHPLYSQCCQTIILALPSK